MLFSSASFGICLLLIGAFLLPPVTTKIENITRQKISGIKKPVIATLLFFISAIAFVPKATEEKSTPIKSTPQGVSQTITQDPPIKLEPPVTEKEAPSEKSITPEPSTKEDIPVKIVDGDTIDVLYEGETERLRIQGMDTPETKDPRYPVQCFGQKATDRAKELLENQNIILETDGSRGKYQRLLAYIRFTDGTDYGEKMIRDGYAWHYSKYPHDRMEAYAEAERFARDNNNGLWSSSTCNGEKKSLEEVVEETKKSVSKIIEEVIPKVMEAPAPIPTPTPIETAPQTTYDCSGNTYNCGDFKTHQEAQNAFEYCQQEVGKDIHKLDQDKNGDACESLPR